MCGVIGLICEKDSSELGKLSTTLLRMLEYRGYDSTGAAIQDADGNIILKKDVGSPTLVTKKLGIDKLNGKIFCGQVRWATFGVVNKANAQPHEVKCKTHIFGAHNGNITNCDQLKTWLVSKGHDIKSDNDGEMLVHTIEHYFAIELEKIDLKDNLKRIDALKKAIIKANTKIIGSFASVVVDPVSETVACIKAGSSLYMGQGFNDVHGNFIIASSDLSAVLSQTKILIPIKENEFSIYNSSKAEVFNIKTGHSLQRPPMRSKLKTEETKLSESYEYFMEQEIFAQISASEKLINLYTGKSKYLELMKKLQGDYADLIKNIKHAIKNLESITELSELKKRSIMFFDSIEVSTLKTIAEKNNMCAENDYTLESSFSGFLFELRKQVSDNKIDPVIKLIDAIFLLEESSDINTRINQFVDKMVQSYEYGSSIYLIACGTSYHAAKTASIFFDKIPGLNIYPLLPGEFRSQYANSIRNRDVLIGISQSGETKDLIDIFNQVEKNSKEVTLISIVNNVNSSLALEKSELFIPLRCGPEISVPATKSFLNQLIVMYILALRLANRFIKLGIKKLCQKKLDGFWENLYKIPDLIKRTISGSDESINIIAQNLFMEPSMHILATGMLGIAKEGALKIREVVLNHTEGFEGAEFKHGPNTILGVNSIFGLDAIKSVMGKLAEGMDDALNTEEGKRLDGKGVLELFKALYNYSFHKKSFTDLDSDMKTLVKKVNEGSHLFDSLYTNYPLIFVTNSSDRDINLTISQINTHKIRGANVFIIAEKNNLLYDAISKVPESKYEVRYKFGYIELPETGDELLPAFTSTVVLQLLALKMSVLKRQLLNKLGIIDHGVHPDSPKNVSKSITVD